LQSAQRTCRVHGTRMQPSLAAAHRILLRAALAEEANAMFVLVSEACIPLYHPALLWAQLISEAHMSRVGSEPEDQQRWSDKIATGHLRKEHFRKSQQWTSLARAHAQYVAFDEHVWTQFELYCRVQVRPPPRGVWCMRACCLEARRMQTRCASPQAPPRPGASRRRCLCIA
jgi:Core-2/I-Branching enzyme